MRGGRGETGGKWPRKTTGTGRASPQASPLTAGPARAEGQHARRGPHLAARRLGGQESREEAEGETGTWAEELGLRAQEGPHQAGKGRVLQVRARALALQAAPHPQDGRPVTPGTPGNVTRGSNAAPRPSGHRLGGQSAQAHGGARQAGALARGLRASGSQGAGVRVWGLFSHVLTETAGRGKAGCGAEVCGCDEGAPRPQPPSCSSADTHEVAREVRRGKRQESTRISAKEWKGLVATCSPGTLLIAANRPPWRRHPWCLRGLRKV